MIDRWSIFVVDILILSCWGCGVRLSLCFPRLVSGSFHNGINTRKVKNKCSKVDGRTFFISYLSTFNCDPTTYIRYLSSLSLTKNQELLSKELMCTKARMIYMPTCTLFYIHMKPKTNKLSSNLGRVPIPCIPYHKWQFSQLFQSNKSWRQLRNKLKTLKPDFCLEVKPQKRECLDT